MKVVNVHRRLVHATPERIAQLIATLGTPGDQVWPRTGWPRMVLDRPLAVGARGGHGPIGYFVEAYEPGALVRFRFTRPAGFDGSHTFEVLDATAHHCVLEHRIEMQTTGLATLKWALAIRWLHDACLRDLLSQVQASLGQAPAPARWSPYVRLLMRLLSRRRSHARTGGARHAA